MDSERLAELVADACDDRKATDIRLIRVDEVSSLADWMVIAGGQSDVQVRAIARSVEDRLETEADLLPLRKEGLHCLLYTSPSPRDRQKSRMPSSA